MGGIIRKLGLPVQLGLILAISSAGLALASSSWLSDAPGYSQAYREHVSLGKPLIVYFYVDWCPYCRGLEKEILNTSEVEAYLSRFPRVKVNPEHGPNEEALAKQFGVHGYPNFLVIPEPGTKPEKISGWTRSGNEWVRAEPGEFVAECRSVLEKTETRAPAVVSRSQPIQPSFQEVVDKDSKHYREAGQREFLAGKKTAALQAFQKCLELAPSDQVALDWAGFVSIQLGRHQRAVGYMNRLIELAPSYGNGRAYYLRAYAYSELGNSVKAKADAQKACQSGYAEGCSLARDIE